MENFMSELGLDKDKDLMQEWLYKWSSSESMPINRWLEDWHISKSNYLLKMFNNQLIIKKEVDIEKSSHLVESEIAQYLRSSFSYHLIQNYLPDLVSAVLFDQGNEFFDHRRKADYDDPEHQEYTSAESFLHFLNDLVLYYYTFAENEIEANKSVQIYNSNKKLVISEGQKPFRAINYLIKNCFPIAQERFPEKFNEKFLEKLKTAVEECRLKISQILNDKRTKGTLCLSIHPMDYMTMSDNGYNWTSCMAWQAPDGEAGCYHAGTVEMMNSCCVVVAYLEGKEEWKPLQDFGLNYIWSNKKWRELFIVDHDFITGIKAYPYEHSQLEIASLKALAELAEKNLGYKYEKNITPFCGEFDLGNYEVHFTTNLMYNDFGSADSNVIKAIEPNFHNFDAIAAGWKKKEAWYNYSGDAFCTVCGEELSDAEQTVCEEHNNKFCCFHCNCYLDENQIINSMGQIYCEDCYARLFDSCDNCETIDHRNQMWTLDIRTDTPKELYDFKLESYKKELDAFHKRMENGSRYPLFRPVRPLFYRIKPFLTLCTDCITILKQDTGIDITNFELNYKHDTSPTHVLIPDLETLKTIAHYFGINGFDDYVVIDPNAQDPAKTIEAAEREEELKTFNFEEDEWLPF